MHCPYLCWCTSKFGGLRRCCYGGQVRSEQRGKCITLRTAPQSAEQSKDAFNEHTSEPLEDDVDETSTYLQGYLHRQLRTSGSTSGTSIVSISGSVGPRTGRA